MFKKNGDSKSMGVVLPFDKNKKKTKQPAKVDVSTDNKA